MNSNLCKKMYFQDKTIFFGRALALTEIFSILSHRFLSINGWPGDATFFLRRQALKTIRRYSGNTKLLQIAKATETAADPLVAEEQSNVLRKWHIVEVPTMCARGASTFSERMYGHPKMPFPKPGDLKKKQYNRFGTVLTNFGNRASSSPNIVTAHRVYPYTFIAGVRKRLKIPTNASASCVLRSLVMRRTGMFGWKMPIVRGKRDWLACANTRSSWRLPVSPKKASSSSTTAIVMFSSIGRGQSWAGSK